MAGTYKNRTRARGKRGKEYIRLSAGPLRNKYVHKFVAEAMLGRVLKEDECVDHRDRNGLNPAPWNLRVVTVIGNSRKSTPPLKGEVIFCGGAYWKERNPDWVDPVGVYV